MGDGRTGKFIVVSLIVVVLGGAGFWLRSRNARGPHSTTSSH